MTRLAALHARITGDSSGFVAAAQSAENAATGLTGAATTTAGAFGSGAAKGGVGLGAVVTATRTKLTALSRSPGMRMLPVQLSQVAQQAAAGTGVLRALTIQAADIGLAFGAVGAVVGTLATVAMPVLIGAFTDSAEATDEFDNALSGIKDTISSLKEPLDILTMDMDELVTKYGEATETVLGLAQAQAQFAVGLAERALRDQLSVMTEVIAAYKEGYWNASKYDSALNDLVYRLDVTRYQARQVAAAIVDVGNATGFDQQVEALQSLVALADEMGFELSDLPPEIQRAVSQTIALTQAMAEATAQMLEASSAAAAISANLPMNSGNASALWGLSGADLLPPMPTGPDPTKTSKRGGGGGGGLARSQDQFERDLERLKEQLATEIEAEQEMHDTRLQLLQDARERELLTEQEYDDLIARERERHNDKMIALDVYRYGTATDKMGQFMGDMATAFASGNEDMLRISKVFGAGEALVNAWRTFTQVMSDPSLPWFAKLPAAISLFGSAVQAVSAIQGAGKGGSGKRSVGRSGGGSAAVGGATIEEAAATPTISRSLTLIGDTFNRKQMIAQAEFLNEGTDDGLIIRGR